MQSLITVLAPLSFFLLIGIVMRRRAILSQQQMSGVTAIIMQVCLPAVLLLTFLEMDLQLRYIWLSVATIVLLTLFLLVGALVEQVWRGRSLLLPFYASGFAFGLLGIPLVTLVFGQDELAVYTVLGVGHELFVWFVYYPLLSRRLGTHDRNGPGLPARLLRSPIVVAITLGISANALGLGPWLIGGGGAWLGTTLELLAGATTPLILIAVGYNLRIDRQVLATGLGMVVMRLAITFGVGYLIKVTVLRPLLGFDGAVFTHMFFALIVLPGLYSLPVFVARHKDRKLEQEASSVVTLGTAVSMVLFVLYVLAMNVDLA